MRALAHTSVGGAALRFGGLLQTLPVHVVKPAVKGTAEPSTLKSSIAKIGAPMRAMAPDQTESTPLVAKQNEILTQHAHRNDGSSTFKFLRQSSRLPEAPQNFSNRSARRTVRESLIFFRTRHSSHLIFF
jgi:hypothetical protein